MSRGCPSDIGAREVISVLLTIKRRTLFVNPFEFTMPENLGLRVILFKASKQGNQRCTLFRRSGISGLAPLIKAPFIADANRVRIVMPSMHAHKAFITRLIQMPITLNVIVVTNTLVTEPGIMTSLEHVDCETPVAAGSAAVNNNQVY